MNVRVTLDNDEVDVVRGALRAALDGHTDWHSGLSPGYRAVARAVLHRLERALDEDLRVLSE